MPAKPVKAKEQYRLERISGHPGAGSQPACKHKTGNRPLDAETFAAKSEPKDLFELVRKEDIDELMSIFPAIRLHYVATDGCPKCRQETLIEAKNLQITVIKEPDAKTQSR